MPPQNDLLATAEHVAALLAENGVPALVIGAIALAAHRYIRFTQDIDLAVNADVGLLRKCTLALSHAGYDAILHEPDADDPLGGVIDITGSFGLVQIVSFADRFPAAITDSFASSQLSLYPGSSLRLIPIPQLVALKLYAGGHKALADIIELLKRNPEQDRAEITRTIKRYRLRGLNVIWRELDQDA
jgi:hypothetical protein